MAHVRKSTRRYGLQKENRKGRLQLSDDVIKCLCDCCPDLNEEQLAVLRGGDLFGDLKKWFEDAAKAIKGAFENAFDPNKNGLKNLIDKALAEVGPALSAVADRLKNDLDPSRNGVGDAFKRFGNDVQGAFNDLGEKIRRQAAADKAALEAAFGPVGDAFKSLGDAQWWRDTMTNPETYFMLASVLITAAGSFLGPGGALIANGVVGAARMITKAARGEQINLSDVADMAVSLIPGGGGAKAATGTAKVAQQGMLGAVNRKMASLSTQTLSRAKHLGESLVSLTKTGEDLGIIPPLQKAKKVATIPIDPETPEQKEELAKYNDEKAAWDAFRTMNQTPDNQDKAYLQMAELSPQLKLEDAKLLPDYSELIGVYNPYAKQWYIETARQAPTTTDSSGITKATGPITFINSKPYNYMLDDEYGFQFFLIKPENPGPPPTVEGPQLPRTFMGPLKGIQPMNFQFLFRYTDVVVMSNNPDDYTQATNEPEFYKALKDCKGKSPFNESEGYWKRISKEEAEETPPPATPYSSGDDYAEKADTYRKDLAAWNALPSELEPPKKTLAIYKDGIGSLAEFKDRSKMSRVFVGRAPLKMIPQFVRYTGKVHDHAEYKPPFVAATSIQEMEKLLEPWIKDVQLTLKTGGSNKIIIDEIGNVATVEGAKFTPWENLTQGQQIGVDKANPPLRDGYRALVKGMTDEIQTKLVQEVMNLAGEAPITIEEIGLVQPEQPEGVNQLKVARSTTSYQPYITAIKEWEIKYQAYLKEKNPLKATIEVFYEAFGMQPIKGFLDRTEWLNGQFQGAKGVFEIITEKDVADYIGSNEGKALEIDAFNSYYKKGMIDFSQNESDYNWTQLWDGRKCYSILPYMASSLDDMFREMVPTHFQNQQLIRDQETVSKSLDTQRKVLEEREERLAEYMALSEEDKNFPFTHKDFVLKEVDPSPFAAQLRKTNWELDFNQQYDEVVYDMPLEEDIYYQTSTQIQRFQGEEELMKWQREHFKDIPLGKVVNAREQIDIDPEEARHRQEMYAVYEEQYNATKQPGDPPFDQDGYYRKNLLQEGGQTLGDYFNEFFSMGVNDNTFNKSMASFTEDIMGKGNIEFLIKVMRKEYDDFYNENKKLFELCTEFNNDNNWRAKQETDLYEKAKDYILSLAPNLKKKIEELTAQAKEQIRKSNRTQEQIDDDYRREVETANQQSVNELNSRQQQQRDSEKKQRDDWLLTPEGETYKKLVDKEANWYKQQTWPATDIDFSVLFENYGITDFELGVFKTGGIEQFKIAAQFMYESAYSEWINKPGVIDVGKDFIVKNPVLTKASSLGFPTFWDTQARKKFDELLLPTLQKGTKQDQIAAKYQLDEAQKLEMERKKAQEEVDKQRAAQEQLMKQLREEEERQREDLYVPTSVPQNTYIDQQNETEQEKLYREYQEALEKGYFGQEYDEGAIDRYQAFIAMQLQGGRLKNYKRRKLNRR